MPPAPPPVVWHYTVGLRWTAIDAAGELRPATAGVVPPERPVVWFTELATWEPTASKLVADGGRLRTMTLAEMMAQAGGLYRVGVAPETAPVTWRWFPSKAQCRASAVRRLDAQARRSGSNPALWRVSLDPVPRALWTAVETWDGAAWVPLP